jgi:hypothetical protein
VRGAVYYIAICSHGLSLVGRVRVVNRHFACTSLKQFRVQPSGCAFRKLARWRSKKRKLMGAWKNRGTLKAFTERRLREMRCVFPGVAKAQPRAGISERFQRYSFQVILVESG